MSIPRVGSHGSSQEGWGKREANHWGKEKSQLTGCGAKNPTFCRAGDPAIQGQRPMAHVVLVRLISCKTATSKQHRAQLISTQIFSEQAELK